ncbi:hypothetical protein Cfla_3186 [Cellulomonas flavigena DSM 20109]|uniref:Uncharacterized protein n=1 Tax=Cellulomonas flavigena (strain ATCC 482 / DSM 20109 / BCRC 11376 / JCM 18109 / NBRC 3775 / NCIMB 8073 / NRS 134) TaxID=446466 RepID=D5ULW2_CELFN|nr:hypothetical protein [Cellulomonas flavigena]ADG76068.1 hypothetical protein Cfla_3186 [Cellulomonas flavigena DSM 20109]
MRRTVGVLVAAGLLVVGLAPGASAMNKTDLIEAVSSEAELRPAKAG